ncbi:hypothetical protein D3C73_1165420 [compost metagenome]
MASSVTPTTTVHTTTATIAIIRIGPMSSIRRRTFMASAVSNNSTGRNTIRKVSDEISKRSSESRKSPIQLGAQPWTWMMMPSKHPTIASNTE